MSQKQTPQGNCIIIWEENWNTQKLPFELYNQIPIEWLNPCQEIKNEDLSVASCIIILAELKCQQKQRSDFYGLQLAKQIRTQLQYCGAIVVCTFMPSFSREKYPNSRLLDTPGIYFMQLPIIGSINLNNLKKIKNDPDLFEDIKSVFNNLDFLKNKMHNLENICSEIKDTNNKILEFKKDLETQFTKGFDEFKPYIAELHKNDFNTLTTSIIKQMQAKVDEKNFHHDMLRHILTNHKELIYSWIPKPLSEAPPINAKPKRWQVLFIDDSKPITETIKNHFHRLNINCLVATTAQDAYNILDNENGAANIVAVICDIRFYENGDSQKGKWQDIQGYQILKHISKSGAFKHNYLNIVLTSKRGTIINQIKKQNNYLWFYKTDVLGGGEYSFNLFASQIEDLASQIYIKRRNIPQIGAWKNGIQNKVNQDFNYTHLYKLHLESIDYPEAEIRINILAEELCKKEELDGGIITPSFIKKDNSENDKFLELFRSKILVYRRVFLIQKLINNKSDEKILKFFQPLYEAKETKKNSKEENQKNYIDTVFYKNWGLPKNIENKINKKDYLSIPNDPILFEEQQLLANLKQEISWLTNNDDVLELADFITELKDKCTWAKDTSNELEKLKIAADKGNATIQTKDIENLFKKIKKDCQTEQFNANKKYLDDCYLREAYIDYCNYGIISLELKKLLDILFLNKI